MTSLRLSGKAREALRQIRLYSAHQVRSLTNALRESGDDT
jgi:hypothetical protein